MDYGSSQSLAAVVYEMEMVVDQQMVLEHISCTVF